jgi:hypothetical protein
MFIVVLLSFGVLVKSLTLAQNDQNFSKKVIKVDLYIEIIL